MDTKNTQPQNAGTTPRNSQSPSTPSQGTNASSSNSATPSASKSDYVNADVAKPKSTSPDLTAGGEQAQSGLIDSALESGKAALESGKAAWESGLESGKKWIADSGVTDTVNEQTKNVQEWGKRTAARVGSLSTTQKVVGGALLAAGLGWLALSGKKNKNSQPNVYGRKGKTGSSFGRAKGYQQDSNESGRGRRAGVLSSMPSFGGDITPKPSTSYDQPISGDNSSRFSGNSSTVSDNVGRRGEGSGYRADA